MKRSSLSIGLMFLLVGMFLGCTNPTGTVDKPDGPVVGFNVTGKVLDKDGKPVVGARAKLLNSGLTAITGSDGSYIIKGEAKLSKTLAKRTASAATEGTDTLVVTVANGQSNGDSSEIVKEVVESGVIFELPPTYIVQREIRGYLTPDDESQVGRIEAVVYDLAVPEKKKYIDLWHDVLNKAFHTFAYFSSATNKQYSLYVRVYDKQNRFIGRSPDFVFPDQAGNIIFKDPFRYDNARPLVTKVECSNRGVVSPTTWMTTIDTLKIDFTAVDSFGGKIVSCDLNVSGQKIAPLSKRLAKRTINGVETDVVTSTFEVVGNTLSPGNKTWNIEVLDNDNNLVKRSVMVMVEEPFDINKLSSGFAIYSSSTGGNSSSYLDMGRTGYFSVSCGVNQTNINFTKVEINFPDTPDKWEELTFTVDNFYLISSRISHTRPQVQLKDDENGIPILQPYIVKWKISGSYNGADFTKEFSHDCQYYYQ